MGPCKWSLPSFSYPKGPLSVPRTHPKENSATSGLKGPGTSQSTLSCWISARNEGNHPYKPSPMLSFEGIMNPQTAHSKNPEGNLSCPKGPRTKRLTFWHLYKKWTKMGTPKGQKVGFGQLSNSLPVAAATFCAPFT